MVRGFFAVVAAWFLSCSFASAQPKTTLKVKPGVIDNIVPVMAHEARCVALSEPFSLLAFGHDRGYPDAHISLVKLDAKGVPSPTATRIKIPIPDPLAKAGTFVTSLVFHPKLPILYAWQDANIPYSLPNGKDPPEIAAFDRLLMFDVSKDPPTLVISLCRGGDYLFGQQGGAVAVDSEGAFLAIPSLRERANANFWRFGRMPLDAQGFPKVQDKELPIPERIKDLQQRSNAEKFIPAELSPIEYVNIFPANAYGCLHSVRWLDRNTLLGGSSGGLFTWRPADKVVTLSAIPLKLMTMTQFDLHPTLPLGFASRYRTDSLFQVGYFDGYWSLIPHQWIIPDAKLASAPVVMPKTNQVLVAGEHRVYAIPLDEQGNAKGEVIAMPLLGSSLRAMVYSPKFDRAYIGMDLSQ